MRNLEELEAYVGHNVLRLRGPSRDDAWHSLVEAGPEALPYVVRAFEETSDLDVKLALAQIVSEYRSPNAVSFFEALLRDAEPEMWRQALDGLVMLGGATALNILGAAREIATPIRREWIDEALAQINQGRSPSE